MDGTLAHFPWNICTVSGNPGGEKFDWEQEWVNVPPSHP